MLGLDQSHNDGAEDVLVGDTFRVQLPENPSTGYRWYLQPIDNGALRLLEDSFEPPQAGLGGVGTRQWTFVGDRPATVELRAELKRSWQPDADKVYRTTICIKPR